MKEIRKDGDTLDYSSESYDDSMNAERSFNYTLLILLAFAIVFLVF